MERPPGPWKLTDKGRATRARIVRHSAELIHTHGLRATNNEFIRNAAGISGSQLTHYFPTKESLVLAVIDWQADDILEFHRSERFKAFDSVEAFQDWADFYILSGRRFEDGCSLGSLASEIVKTDLDIHDELARVFKQWHDIFREGLERMQQLGRINASADPAQLAHMFLAAYQGGMLLAQIARDISPLQHSLYAAVDHLRTFVTTPDDSVSP
ncbi:TetR/AcrR family transcriptional regulator [Diaminobutyricibacter tongyongensis]|uniref:TetR/AcrR family transcriptional regulator n=1 Tax=Leifsonia tongyongensis TaxID=1268043 RepID=A0A6L9Y2C9_9MICO|nr:TetR/AcrR family transcriptional regulator [Diaminobutyricibacter tongyongensis]NEN07831.1 TetR/AcrR family transcriptional regulator [Diaminobutyricibacter tongyongensis]